MELKEGKITMLFGEDGLKIEVWDGTASIMFAKIKIEPEQTLQAFSRLACVPCKTEVFGLDKVGKKMISENFIFEVPRYGLIPWKEREAAVGEIAKKECPEGWEPGLYFNGQNSFFEKNGQNFARTYIKKWVEI